MVKTCKKCGLDKEEKEFSRNRVRKDGLNDWCKSCVTTWRQEKKKVDPDMERRVKVRQLYGIELEEYRRLMATGCAICGGPGQHLDHDHASGVARAALCQNCNLMLGQARDNPAILRAAAADLESHA